ncbi:MAG: bifunctional 4-hydroxy-2-oxoglutarate aldolase/2-dehydro-3-deoxy-phosphogluconate aldolase [Haliea sp.]
MSGVPDMQKLDYLMGAAPVIPVLTVDDAGKAVPLAATLVSAGLTVLEITLRTPMALEIIRRIAAEVPQACVGAGTVLCADDLDRVADAGARFAISPGATSALYERARTLDLPFLPGVATAGEILAGREAGWYRFKLFPAAASGGIKLLKSLHGPLPDVSFCPTGGIGPGDFRDYLALPNVPCVGGSWMVPTQALHATDWPHIGQLARDCF